MRSLLTHIAVIVALALALSSCQHRGKVIPKDQFASLYADILAADQWLIDHPEARKQADTTFFYEPVLKKYGYDVLDYDASLRHYLKEPDKFATLLLKSEKKLDAEIARVQRLVDLNNETKRKSALLRGYEEKDFKDSIHLDEYAERRNSVRAHKVEAPGQLAGD